MRHFGYKRRKKTYGNTVIHVPATVDGTIVSAGMTLFVIASPSIFAAESASVNIEAQDKDRTVNVGHHIGRINIDLSIRQTTGDGALEACVFKVERLAGTPTIGTHPVPSVVDVLGAGMQQACRLANPGKVFHFSTTAYSADNTRTKKIIVSPAKYRLSKLKAGDHWLLLVFNRGAATFTIDFQCRYKEFE